MVITWVYFVLWDGYDRTEVYVQKYTHCIGAENITKIKKRYY